MSRTLYYRWKKRFLLYIGNLKGMGKLWQLTSCDGSYAMDKVIPADNATEAASFLRDVVAVELREAGWNLWRVLTDGGSEFKGGGSTKRVASSTFGTPGRGPDMHGQRIRRAVAGNDPP